MTYGFSLSRPHPLPTAVEQGGETYPVRTDFKVILRALAAAADPEVREADRPLILNRLFYEGEAPADAWAGFAWFVGCGRERGEAGGTKDFDYEQDAMEIYAAFRQLYGVDLFEADMHWWVFCALLENATAGENALSNKIRLRHMDDSRAQHEAAVDRAKRGAALAADVSRTEAAFQEELTRRLQAGEPIDDLLNGGNDNG